MSELKTFEIVLAEEINFTGVVKYRKTCYDKTEADKYIVEIKQKLHDAEMRADLAEAAATERKIDYDNLKKDVRYHARKVYFKTHRQTLRALWLARAERAKCKIEWFRLWNTQISTMNPEDGARQEYDRWLKVEQLCKEKAEEYK